ncbi:MAG: aspartate carbamoyltransferase catalytic subunit [Dehalococcoidia bacterium]|jgi:aspartate carbamoyltransferase catalytic subunit|nr:aspartate carbamoyltransferase catalytic subunit [Dehalococcoidia bacterium]
MTTTERSTDAQTDAQGNAQAGSEVQQAVAPAVAPSSWQHDHVLDLDDFSREEIETVLDTAERMREILDRRIARVPALRGFTVINLFYEPSTRTRASFELAGKVLGADVVSLNATTSSVAKGESLIDTVRTLRAMSADAIVLRHSAAGAPYLAAEHTEASILNAGDGSHAHPTQALLDLYTMRRHVGDLRGKRVVMVGDISHSRVARSDLWALATMGAEVVVCGPPTLLPRGLRATERPSHAESALPPVTIETDVGAAIDGADVVMALRLQSERQQGGLLPSLHEYATHYQVTSERLARAHPDHLLMHPGPKNEGIEIAGDVAAGDHSIIEEQVTNGVAVRMALLYLLAGREGARAAAPPDTDSAGANEETGE